MLEIESAIAHSYAKIHNMYYFFSNVSSNDISYSLDQLESTKIFWTIVRTNCIEKEEFYTCTFGGGLLINNSKKPSKKLANLDFSHAGLVNC